jgi:hypothetical protein
MHDCRAAHVDGSAVALALVAATCLTVFFFKVAQPTGIILDLLFAHG